MSDFMQQYAAYKDEFLGEYKSGKLKFNFKEGVHGQKAVLESFEQWLKKKKQAEKRVSGSAAAKVPASAEKVVAFNSFLDDVLQEAQKILAERGIKITCLSLCQRIGIAESWKCIRVFSNSNIFYRIGKTKPRKGPYQGKEYLVVDLVMDGHKKQVFRPLLQKKSDIENVLGVSLARELPKVEATGKYRLKLMLPYDDVVEEKNIGLVANKLADFVDATKPYLHEVGVI